MFDLNWLHAEIANTIVNHNVTLGIEHWAKSTQKGRNCEQVCMFGAPKTLFTCAQCLEGHLRTVNLYKHIPVEADCLFLKAANELRRWSEKETCSISLLRADQGSSGTCEYQPA